MTKYTVKSELTDTPWQIENRTKKINSWLMNQQVIKMLPRIQ